MTARRAAGPRRRKGATAVETGLLVALIAMAILGSVWATGVNLAALFGMTANRLQNGGIVDPSIPSPDAFAFAPLTDRPLSLLVQSEAVTLTGIDGTMPVSLERADGGAMLAVDGGSASSVHEGSVLQLSMVTAPTSETLQTATVRVGGRSVSWDVTTGDDTPDAIAIAAKTQAPGESWVVSDAIPVAGTTLPARFTLQVASGTVARLYRPGDTVSDPAGGIAPGTPVDVEPARSLRIGVQTGVADGSSRVATLSYAGGSADFVVTTTDSMPDFAPATLDPVAPGAVAVSAAMPVEGYEGTLPVTVSGDGGPQVLAQDAAAPPPGADAGWSAGTTISPGQVLYLAVTAPAADRTMRTVAVGVGGVTQDWSVYTGDSHPDALALTPIYDARGATRLDTGWLTPAGFDVPATASVSGDGSPELLLADGTHAATLTLEPGVQLKLAMTSGDEDGAPRVVHLDLNGAGSDWTVVAPDLIPDAVVFADTSGHARGSWAESGSATITGVSAATRVDAQAPAQVSVNGGDWTSFGYVGEQGTVRLRQPIPADATTGQAFTASARFGDIGGRTPRTASWTARAGGNDKLPELTEPVFAAATGQEPNGTVYSAEVTLGGFDAAADLRLSGSGDPMVILDGLTPRRAGADDGVTVRPGQVVQLQMNAGSYGTSGAVTVRLGDAAAGQWVQTVWTVSVRAEDKLPDGGYVLANITQPQGPQTVYSALAQPYGYLDPIELKISGADAASVQASLNGGAWVSATNGSFGTLTPGQSYQLRMTVALADGSARSASIAVGNAAAFTWQVATLDMVPDAPPATLAMSWPPAWDSWVQGSDGGRWMWTISGLTPGVRAPFTWGGTASPLIFSADGSTSRGAGTDPFVANGEIVSIWAFAGYDANATTTGWVAVGGQRRDYSITTTNTARNPRRYFFDDVDNAPASGRVWSGWIVPYLYGAPMAVAFDSADGTQQMQVRHAGVEGAATSSATIVEGDAIRISLDLQGAAQKTLTVRYNGSGGVTTPWTVRAAAPAAKKPNPFYVTSTTVAGDGVREVTIDYGLNQWCPTIVDSATGGPLQGYQGPIQVVLRSISGGPAGADLERVEDYAGYYVDNPMTLSPGQSIRFCSYPDRVPGNVQLFQIVAGNLSDPAQQTVTQVRVRIASVDNDPDPATLSFGTPLTGAAGNTLYTSNATTVGGFSYTVAAAVSGDPSARLVVNGGSPVTSAQLSSGQQVAVQLTSGPTTGVARTATVTFTGKKADGSAAVYTSSWSVTTVADRPTGFGFAALTEAEPDSWVASGFADISGLSGPTPFSVAGLGSPRVEIGSNGQRLASGTLKNGDRIRLWNYLSGGYATAHVATLTVGSATQVPWSVTTRAADTAPDFAFGDMPSAVPGIDIYSDPVTPAAFRDPAPVTLLDEAGGTAAVSLNGGPYVADPAGALLTPGQSVQLRLTSSANVGEVRRVTLTIGGVARIWSVTAGAVN